MRGTPVLLILAAGCRGTIGAVVDDSDVVVDEHTEYDGANLRITAPSSGALLWIEEPRTFTAEVRDALDVVMPYDEIAWSSTADALWVPIGATFSDEALAPGLHDLTAEAELPNGDRVAHTIGGVRVQSKWAGTYAGLFTSALTMEIQQTPVTLTCSGVATVVVDLLGETAVGDSACVLSVNGIDIPAAYVFALTNEDGALTGTASVDLQIAEVPFECTGAIDPDTHALTLAFGGEIPFVGVLEGGVDAERVSLDVE